MIFLKTYTKFTVFSWFAPKQPNFIYSKEFVKNPLFVRHSFFLIISVEFHKSQGCSQNLVFLVDFCFNSDRIPRVFVTAENETFLVGF